MRSFVAGLLGLTLLLGAPLSSESQAPDWIVAGDAAYPVLLKGAQQAGLKGWEVDVLNAGKPLPQASARTLAQKLERSAAVDEGLKVQLETLLPDEPLDQPGLDAEVAAAQARLDKLNQGMADVNTEMAANNYSPTTDPTAWLTMDSAENYVDVKGIGAMNFSQEPTLLSAEMRGASGVGTYRVVIGVDSDDQDEGNNKLSAPFLDPDASVNLLGSLFGVDNVQANLGFESLLFSKLIYSAPAFAYQSPFFQADAAVASMHADAPNGERNTQGLYLRKQGSQGWWIFNDAQAFISPEAEFFREFNHRHGYESAVRLDLPSLGGIPFADSTLVYMTYYFYGNDPGEFPTFYNDSQFYQNPSFQEWSNNAALDFESQLSGGGTLIGEVAQSSWAARMTPLYPELGNVNLSDQAGFLAFSKSVGRVIFGLQGSEVGPRFVPGGHDGNLGGLGGNTTGIALDTLLARDPRNDMADNSWSTVSEDPAWITNNSRKISLSATWLESLGQMNLNIGTSQEMEATGPWVIGTNFFNNSPYNGYTYSQMFYDNYTDFGANVNTDTTGQANQAYFNYNAPTTHAANYQGAPVNSPLNPGIVKWDDMEQLSWRQTTHMIWLSKGGVGDDNLMADSVKYYNTLHWDWTIDGGAIFHSSRNIRLTLFEEIRDTAQEPGLADPFSQFGGMPSDLLVQSITGADLVWQFSQDWQFLATGGHENWATDHSYYPIHFVDNSVGVGADALLTEMVDGLKINFRVLELDHEDQYLPSRNFSGWRVSLGFNYAFKD
jgi:hypothetical protein